MMQKVSYGYVVTNNTALPAYGELTKKVLYKDKLHSAFNQYFFFIYCGLSLYCFKQFSNHRLQLQAHVQEKKKRM